MIPLHRHAVEALALGVGDVDFGVGTGDGFVAEDGEPGVEVGGVLELVVAAAAAAEGGLRRGEAG